MPVGKTRKKTKKTTEKKSNYRRVGTIWNSDKFDGQYFSTDKECVLLYLDPETDKYYKVKQIGVFDPHEKAPEAVAANLSLDLSNEYHVEEVEDDE